MLLLTSHLRWESGKVFGWMCEECMQSIGRNMLPKHALTNNLWLGDIPLVLSMLTLPEQMLIARHFPVVMW